MQTTPRADGMWSYRDCCKLLVRIYISKTTALNNLSGEVKVVTYTLPYILSNSTSNYIL